MAQPHVTEVGLIQESFERLYHAVTGLFETNLVNIREHLNTGVAQTSSEIYSLKQEIEMGRSSVQRQIDSLADAISAATNHSKNVESTDYGKVSRQQ
jgi:hypothetical protein